jgi:hypothetical protein
MAILPAAGHTCSEDDGHHAHERTCDCTHHAGAHGPSAATVPACHDEADVTANTVTSVMTADEDCCVVSSTPDGLAQTPVIVPLQRLLKGAAAAIPVAHGYYQIFRFAGNPLARAATDREHPPLFLLNSALLR